MWWSNLLENFRVGFVNYRYCDFSRKNFRPATVGTVTEIWPALVAAGCATADQAFESERLVVS